MMKFSFCTMCALFLFGRVTLMEAAGITPPSTSDYFSSKFTLSASLLPAYTGAPGNVNLGFSGTGPTTVARELNAFSGYYGTDTVNTEMVSMNLSGSVVTQSPGTSLVGAPVYVRVGDGNGFLSGLQRTGGQIAETLAPSSPLDLNGILDKFPAMSIFDVFFDVWLDANKDSIVDNGEVLRNFNEALRMSASISAFPPYGTPYTSGYNASWSFSGDQTATVSADDPAVGTFGAADPLLTLVRLYVVNPDGTNSGILAATIDPFASHAHTPVPEPSTISLVSVGMAVALFLRLRRNS